MTKRKDSRPPATLYHYTSAAGLHGIVKEHAVWATGISYLNDEDEFAFGFRMMVELLTEFTKRRTKFASWRDIISDYADQSAGIHVGVFSLSEHADLLSQWRGYARNGFSIGFSIHRLTEIAHEANYNLARCIYEVPKQRQMLRSLVHTSVELYGRRCSEGASHDQALVEGGYALLVNCIRLAPLLKNPAFTEEREWRLISRIHRADSGDWQIRVKSTHFVPYLCLSLGEPGASPIGEVVVGPNPAMDIALLGVHQLRHSYAVDLSPRKSIIPYRSHG
jgi:hypothetical protein